MGPFGTRRDCGNRAVPTVPYRPCRTDRAVPTVPYRPCRTDRAVPTVPYRPCRTDRAVPTVPYRPCRTDRAVPTVPYRPCRTDRLPTVPYRPCRTDREPPASGATPVRPTPRNLLGASGLAVARLRRLAAGRRRPQHPQMPATAHLDALSDRLLGGLRPSGLPYRVRQGLQVVAGWLRGFDGQPDDLPAERRGQPLGMRRTQVVAVRLDVGRKWPKHSSGVTVYVGEGTDGRSLAGGSGATTGTHLSTSLVYVAVSTVCLPVPRCDPTPCSYHTMALGESPTRSPNPAPVGRRAR